MKVLFIGFLVTGWYTSCITSRDDGTYLVSFFVSPRTTNRLLLDSLSGQLPAGLANCPGLRVLDVKDNKMDGNIPNEYSNLKRLELFVTSGNNFSGTMPKDVCTLMATDSRKFIETDCDKVECSCCESCR